MGLSEKHRVGVVEEEGRSRRRGGEVGALSVYRGSWGGGGRGMYLYLSPRPRYRKLTWG